MNFLGNLHFQVNMTNNFGNINHMQPPIVNMQQQQGQQSLIQQQVPQMMNQQVHFQHPQQP